jgi:SulP family sulfate permease
MLKFTTTLLATVTLDLSWAIAIGCGIAAIMFLNQASQISITVTPIDPARLHPGVRIDPTRAAETRVAYLTGPLFFAATGHLAEAFHDLSGIRTLILSMRGVPLIDSSGLKALSDLQERIRSSGGQLLFAGLNPPVEQALNRGGVLSGSQGRFWSSGEAIAAAAGSPAPTDRVL